VAIQNDLHLGPVSPVRCFATPFLYGPQCANYGWGQLDQTLCLGSWYRWLSSLCLNSKFAKVSKDQSNILHPKMSQIARKFSATFPNFLRDFCHKFSATFGFFERNFLGGLHSHVPNVNSQWKTV